MHGRLYPRLLVLGVLAASVNYPLVAQANRPKPEGPPSTMHGFLRYEVRGLTAVSGGFLAGMFKTQGMYLGIAHRALPNFLKLLGGMAKVSKDPSVKEANDFLRSGGPDIDLSSLPVSASYGVELEFTLEQVKDGWRLQRGSYRWSSETFASLSAGAAEMTDKFRGQGSGALDPKTSSITLTTSGKRGSIRAHFDVAVNFPVQVQGKSLMKNGPMSLSSTLRGDRVIFEATMGMGYDHREVHENPPSLTEFSFSRSGPLKSVIKGLDIYQDLLDSGVKEEWELWPKCAAQIEEPGDNAELVYDDKRPGRLVHKAFAEVQPTFWGDDLHWEFPKIDGSTLDTPPEKANGNDFDITYTNLPEENSAFKLTEVKARFDTDRAKRAGCMDPEQHDVGYFFLRDGVNHGGPPGLKSDSNPDKLRPNPNWFHYWLQTKANPALPTAFVRYGANEPGCTDARGFYEYGRAYIVICDPGDFVGWNPLAPGYYPEGIDNFASTLRHEKQHYDNYRRWWSAGWDPRLDTDAADPGSGKKGQQGTLRGRRGEDGDLIPDLLEHSVPVPREVKIPPGKKSQFDPNLQDTFGYGVEDEHYLAWAAALRWKPGSADAEDWSCPGHQTFECGQ